MIKIGLTGSIASGKTTASKIISRKRGPLFSADDVVKKLYKNTRLCCNKKSSTFRNFKKGKVQYRGQDRGPKIELPILTKVEPCFIASM